MTEININADSIEDTVRQMQGYLGGTMRNQCGEHILEFDGHLGKGRIKCLTFDWGLSVLMFDAFFFDDLVFVHDHVYFNPINFSFCSKGQFSHRFSDDEDYQEVKQYHTSIIVAQKGLKHYTRIPRNIDIVIHTICLVRQEFLKKRLNNIEHLNELLYKVFMDVKGQESFAYDGPIHFRMADHLHTIRANNVHNISRLLEIEGEVYQMLSMHIARQDLYEKSNLIPTRLLNNDLKIIRQLSKKIVDCPSEDYTLDRLSKESGLNQATLQEGFKFLYSRTVTDYIRHIRLVAAVELMNTSDLNISQIVYSIGFTSRSYFSKIFRQKYVYAPNEYKKKLLNRVVLEG